MTIVSLEKFLICKIEGTLPALILNSEFFYIQTCKRRKKKERKKIHPRKYLSPNSTKSSVNEIFLKSLNECKKGEL